MNRRRQETTTLLLTLIVLLLTGVNSARFFVRLDLTGDKAYSITPVSRALVRELPEQLRITYYLSERLRARAPETRHLVDLLQEYSAYSRGRVEIEVVDPAAEGLSGDAEALGVLPQQIQVIEQDQQSLATVYTGVVIRYLNRSHTLPVVFDPRTFEYELTSSVRNLVRAETPVIGVILGRSQEALEREYQILTARLERNYRLRVLAIGEPVPPDVDALFVIGSKDVSNEDLLPIDDYLAAGGRALFALSGVDVDLESSALSAVPVDDAPLFSLLRHYGINVRRELVLDRFHQSIPVAQSVGGRTVQSMEPYPHWVSVVNYNSDHPVSARFTGLDLFWPSPLDIGIVDGVELEILLESSTRSWLMGEPYITDPSRAHGFERDALQSQGRYVLAAAISGPLQRYFPDREPAAGASPPGRVVVIGDSDFLSNILQYTGSGYNIDFAENLAGWLSLDDDLLSIRTRAARDSRLNFIQDPAIRRRVGAFAASVNVFVVPLMVVVFGVGHGIKRRRMAGGRPRRVGDWK